MITIFFSLILILNIAFSKSYFKNSCYYINDCYYRPRPILIWDSFSSRYYPISSFNSYRYSSYYSNYSSYYYSSYYDPYYMYGEIKISFPSEAYYYDYKEDKFKKSNF